MAIDDLQKLFRDGASVVFSADAFLGFSGIDIRHAIEFGESEGDGKWFVCHGPCATDGQMLKLTVSVEVIKGFRKILHVHEATVYREA